MISHVSRRFFCCASMLVRLLSSELLSASCCWSVSCGKPCLPPSLPLPSPSDNQVLARALRCATVIVLMWYVCTTLGWLMEVASRDSLPTLIFLPPLLAVPGEPVQRGNKQCVP